MLRPLQAADIEQLLVIESAVHAAPWNEETFRVCLQGGSVGWAAALSGQVLGFVLVSIHTEECHVLNLSVAKAYQHQGWGHQLLEHALHEAKKKGAGIAYLEVRRSNVPAIHLYKKMAFHLIGERKNYYPTASGHEDALIFAKSLHDIPLKTW